jgi:E3 ubiquitin-protein ligase RNF115/126
MQQKERNHNVFSFCSHTAPPPAPDDVIAALPKRPLSEKEFSKSRNPKPGTVFANHIPLLCLEEQIDCSVCKEDFVLEESVIELPCMHLYHDDCINPWLKVNGTCPVW